MGILVEADAQVSKRQYFFTAGVCWLAATMTSIRLETNLGDEALRVLGAKSRQVIRVALREIVALKHFKIQWQSTRASR